MAVARSLIEVSQEFRATPTESVQPRRACIVGGNAYLHRYADDKTAISLGAYDRLADQAYDWPGRHAGGKVDAASVRLFADNARLLYFEDLIGQASGGKGTVTPVSGKKNRVVSSATTFASNADNDRSALLYDRDVQIGDHVYLRGVFDPEDSCENVELWTSVTGLIAAEGDGSVVSCAEDDGNAAMAEEDATIEQIAGEVNSLTFTADATGYNGLADGCPTETYRIEVVKSSVSGCNAARLRVTSTSGLDDADEVEPAEFGSPTDIGSRGLTVTFDDDELVVGQIFEVVVAQDFEPPCCQATGDYSGARDDVYIIEVTKGGLWADSPEITVTTVKGLDMSGPTAVTAANTPVSIGSYGVTFEFVDCYGSNASQAAYEGATFGGDTDLAGLNKGDKYYVTVETGVDGPIRTLVLKHDLPVKMRDCTDLDLRLFIPVAHLEIDHDRASAPPATNFTAGTTQITVAADVTTYASTWTDNGRPMALTLYSGDLYVQYREWLPDLVDELNFINDVADLDAIPGQLDPDNPLKYGAFLSLGASNGTAVGYIAVADPDDVDSWQAVLDKVDGRDDIYNPVALTRNRAVLLLFQAHVNDESGPEQGFWKGTFVNLTLNTTKMLVGQSSEADQAIRETSTDGELVLATLEDDPDSSGSQYTILSVPSGNANFETYGVEPGCIVRYLFTRDAFGNDDYSEFVVDEVLSENSLRLLSGHTRAVAVAQKLEIWKTLSPQEMIDDVKQQAQSYNDWRVVATFPDRFVSGGKTVDGYFLGCIYAGLVSGIWPHQPVSNLGVPGIDDISARTTKIFSERQLVDLESGGIAIFSQDRDGTPYLRRGLTTDTIDLKHSEEMMRRNYDAVAASFKGLLEPYRGLANATPTMVQVLKTTIEDRIRYLATFSPTSLLGPQLIAGVIASDGDGSPIIRIYPLSEDTIEVVLDLTFPAPLNKVKLHLIA